MRARPLLFFLSSVLAAGCAESTLPPYPEAFVVVDTNLPIPGLVSRLRIDLYAADGTWFDSRDVGLPDARDWPASFSVYSDDDSRERTVWVRLRAYPDTRVRDYRGERRLEWSAPFVVPPGDGLPRLLRGLTDLTPTTEPDPLLAVDRLVRVVLRPGASEKTEVLLHGACLGTMPVIDALASGAAESCVDREKERVPVAVLPTSRDLSVSPTRAGTWLALPCGAPRGEDSVCVPGGGTILGSADQLVDPQDSPSRPSKPVRAFGVTTFWMDRTEVTVGQMRAALAAGLAASAPVANEGPLGKPDALDDPRSCTYSKTPRDREDWGVSCVSWDTARAYCKAKGGDLATEAQWEHAATMAARPGKTRYPWGNDETSCARAATSRYVFSDDSPCIKEGLGGGPVTARPGDVTPFGALGLGGALSEWVRDTYADYTSECWAATTIADPTCASPRKDRGFRGASWMGPLAWSSYRVGFTFTHGTVAHVGFRCVYEVLP